MKNMVMAVGPLSTEVIFIEKSTLLAEIQKGEVVGILADQPEFTVEDDAEALQKEGFYLLLDGEIAWIKKEQD